MIYPDYNIERSKIEEGYRYVVGTDEVGYGAGAGPVVASAVHIPEEHIDKFIGKVNDSKKLSVKKREILFDLIMEYCIVGVKDISAEIIDSINILEANKLAMTNAIEQTEYYDYVLIDGTVDLSKHIIYCPKENIIKGDTKSISIAAASIIAKVTRDRMMIELDKQWPIYDWKNNKGYLVPKHLEALKIYGPCEFHRLSFKRVGR